ncbi:AbrB/MazE/SpoVT family DNA-binding domain-containing protein [Cyanobium sp. HWJ4-Hawea]|uniref:AbrB/MazE/SpoVT family DNA-binding domain-containing protein n=1 Tax=Cyanobium sp. HWJ4-Hawea TaxID=2823713 RepID=UPI0020CF71D6|nr:AbrB/MazE/SpoVT family DNA-binding domain-containing protein [Cyanobium sp. HWJ4-Hawea]MCP9809264.1 AbrB/MazE/SpoVT family DNA-binding domain-containing protein [Cyanobium sp. HWJ4-Hawea]
MSTVPHANLRATPFVMGDNASSVDVSLGRQGRLVIPAALRRSLGLEEGDRLVARQDANRLVIEKPEQIKQRLKARFAQVPADRRLLDELISERREESRLEGEG